MIPKELLIKGEYYVSPICNGEYYYTMRCSENGTYMCDEHIKIFLEGERVDYLGIGHFDSVKIEREATEEEIQWLDECIIQMKGIRKSELIQQTYSIF